MSFLRDSFWTFFIQAAGALVQLAIGVILARTLLAEGRGVYGLVVLIPNTAVVVASLGIGATALRQVAKDRALASRAAANALVLALVSGGATAALLAAFLPALEGYTRADRPALILALISIPLLVFDQFAQFLLAGIGHVVVGNALKLVQLCTALVLLPLCFAQNGANVTSALWSWTISYVISDVIALWNLARRVKAALRIDLSLMASALSFGLRWYPATLAMFLLFRVDLFLMPRYRPLKDVGVYALATSLATLFQLFCRAIERAFVPRIMARGAGEAAVLTSLVTRSFVLIMSPLAVVAVVLAYPLVPLMFGAEFGSAPDVFALFLPGMLVANVGILLNGDILGRGHPLIGTSAALVCLASNVGLNLVLIPRYGMLGAATASLVCYSQYGILLAVAYRRLSSVSLREIFVPSRADIERLRALLTKRAA